MKVQLLNGQKVQLFHDLNIGAVIVLFHSTLNFGKDDTPDCMIACAMSEPVPTPIGN
jgi:hypothetical protein